jgi:hypothetical protein
MSQSITSPQEKEGAEGDGAETVAFLTRTPAVTPLVLRGAGVSQ